MYILIIYIVNKYKYIIQIPFLPNITAKCKGVFPIKKNEIIL